MPVTPFPLCDRSVWNLKIIAKILPVHPGHLSELSYFLITFHAHHLPDIHIVYIIAYSSFLSNDFNRDF